jgi:hypothetical protein
MELDTEQRPNVAQLTVLIELTLGHLCYHLFQLLWLSLVSKSCV